jgi:uncharacterized protein (DUF4415 family)
MSAKKKFDPVIHDENPEWTAEDFAKSKPAEDLPPEILAQFRNKAGRPRLESPKEAVKLRLDADVVLALRETGPGWQTRVNAMLRSKMKGGKMVIGTPDDKPKGRPAPPSKRKRA